MNCLDWILHDVQLQEQHTYFAAAVLRRSAVCASYEPSAECCLDFTHSFAGAWPGLVVINGTGQKYQYLQTNDATSEFIALLGSNLMSSQGWYHSQMT